LEFVAINVGLKPRLYMKEWGLRTKAAMVRVS
jgi:hypothetical protein